PLRDRPPEGWIFSRPVGPLRSIKTSTTVSPVHLQGSSALKCGEPVDLPTTDDSPHHSPSVQERLVGSKGKFIDIRDHDGVRRIETSHRPLRPRIVEVL